MDADIRPLAALVREVHSSGFSYRDMAARARRAGHSISHSQLSALAADEVAKAPTDDQLRGIAAALDLGYEKVRSAMFESYYGYVPRTLGSKQAEQNGSSPVIAAAIPEGLTPAQEKELAKVIRLWAGLGESE